jgi:hypothetical protein
MKKLLFLFFSLSSINILSVNVINELNKKVKCEISLKRFGFYMPSGMGGTFYGPGNYGAGTGARKSKIKFTIGNVGENKVILSHKIAANEDPTFYIRNDGVYVKVDDYAPIQRIYLFE